MEKETYKLWKKLRKMSVELGNSFARLQFNVLRCIIASDRPDPTTGRAYTENLSVIAPCRKQITVLTVWAVMPDIKLFGLSQVCGGYD